MNFRISWSLVLSILCSCICIHVLKAEEKCYRGDQFEYQNPCSEDPSNKLVYCPQGRKLRTPCTEECDYCEPGTYQDAQYHNCTTCLPCITVDDCAEGQEIVEICNTHRNAKCGCPPCPKCLPCTYSPAVPCSPCTSNSEQITKRSMSTVPTIASVGVLEHNFAPCHQYWISLMIMSVLFVAAVFAVISLGYCLFVSKRSAHYKAIPGVSRDAGAHDIELENQWNRRTEEDTAGDDVNLPSKDASTPPHEGDFRDGGQCGSNTHSKDSAKEGNRGTEAFKGEKQALLEEAIQKKEKEDQLLKKHQEDLKMKDKEIAQLKKQLEELKEMLK